jgi:hypothetical protein
MDVVAPGRPRPLTRIHVARVLVVILLGHVGLMATPVHALTHAMLPHAGDHGAPPPGASASEIVAIGHDVPLSPRPFRAGQRPDAPPAPDCRFEAVAGSVMPPPAVQASVLLPPWMQPRSVAGDIARRVDRPPRAPASGDPLALLQVFRN